MPEGNINRAGHIGHHRFVLLSRFIMNSMEGSQMIPTYIERVDALVFDFSDGSADF